MIVLQSEVKPEKTSVITRQSSRSRPPSVSKTSQGILQNPVKFEFESLFTTLSLGLPSRLMHSD